MKVMLVKIGNTYINALAIEAIEPSKATPESHSRILTSGGVTLVQGTPDEVATAVGEAADKCATDNWLADSLAATASAR